MAEPGRFAFTAGAAALVVVPLAIALADEHLAAGPAALVVSTAAGTLAVSALALQPLLAARARTPDVHAARRTLGWHRALGAVVLALVLAHVGALMLVSVEDTLFAMSPDGPTRARMALIALIALVAVVLLGAARRRLPLSPSTWRVLHAYLATLVITLGLGHALLTSGALEDSGTVVLVVCGLLGLGGVAFAHLARRRGGTRERLEL